MSYDSNEKPASGGTDTGLENNGANEVSRNIDLAEINFNEGVFDPVAAVEFACRFGPPNVMKIQDASAPIPPNALTKQAAIDYIANNPGGNFYFCPAALRDAFLGKPKQSDCIGSDVAWVDIDPPKGMNDAEALKSWAINTLAEIQAMDLPLPHIIVFSGRGLWLYWRLTHRLPSAHIEAINYALANCFDGGDSCYSVDHIARLPFTRNSKTGLVSFVLRDVEGRIEPAKLPAEEPPSKTSDYGVELGQFKEARPYDEDEFRELVGSLPCSQERKNQLLLAALDPALANQFRKEPLDIHDRSAVMYSWVIRAIMADMELDEVRNCILSPGLQPISAHLLDSKKYRPSARERAAKRNIARAYAKAVEYGWKPKSAEPPSSDQQEAPLELELISLAPVPDDLPPRPWLVEGLLMDGQVSMLTGRGGEGKSLLALQFGIMVATGKEMAWWKPRQNKKVLVLNAEDDLDEQRRRLLGACAVMGVEQAALSNRLFMPDTQKLVLIQRNPETSEVNTTPLYDQLSKRIKEEEIGLLIIDPLVETHANLDENSNTDMKDLIIALRKLARHRKIPILIVHHSRKGASGGDQDGARGGSALVNACRIVLTLDRMDAKTHDSIHPPLEKESYVRVTGAKANYAGRIGDRWLELMPVILDNNDTTPGFKRVEFGQLDEGFDPHTWEYRDEFLAIVREGRGDDIPWSTALTGKKAARLDATVAERFGIDAGLAKKAIARFANEGLIKVATQKDGHRKPINVWVVDGEALPKSVEDLPF